MRNKQYICCSCGDKFSRQDMICLDKIAEEWVCVECLSYYYPELDVEKW